MYSKETTGTKDGKVISVSSGVLRRVPKDEDFLICNIKSSYIFKSVAYDIVTVLQKINIPVDKKQKGTTEHCTSGTKSSTWKT